MGIAIQYIHRGLDLTGVTAQNRHNVVSMNGKKTTLNTADEVTEYRRTETEPTELLAQLVEDRDGDAVQRGLDEHHRPEPRVVDPHVGGGSISLHQDLSCVRGINCARMELKICTGPFSRWLKRPTVRPTN